MALAITPDGDEPSESEMTSDRIERMKEIDQELGRKERIDEFLASPEFNLYLFEISPDAILVVNDHGVIVKANVQAAFLFGYEKEEMVGQKIEMLIPLEYRERHVKHVAQYMTDPKLRPMGLLHPEFSPLNRLEGQHKNGARFDVEISLGPAMTKLGAFIIATVRRRGDHHEPPASE